MNADTVGSCFIEVARISGLKSSPQAHRASPALQSLRGSAGTIHTYLIVEFPFATPVSNCRLRRRCSLLHRAPELNGQDVAERIR